MFVDNINIEPLIRAFGKLERFRANCQTEQDKAGIVQAFEYTYELAWKTMKRLLKERGKEANSPRETFRMAALEGLISDPEVWFEFIKARNLSVHTYEENILEKLLPIIETFDGEIKSFLNNLGYTNAKN